MTVTLLEGHVVDVLAPCRRGTSTCACTSPPYLWLRSVQTEPQVWQTADGGRALRPGASTSGGRTSATAAAGNRRWARGRDVMHGQVLRDSAQCHQGAKPGGLLRPLPRLAGELGQEPPPRSTLHHLVEVFRAVKRVLRADGTLWVNLAGSYFNDPGGQNGARHPPQRRGATPPAGANTKHKALHASPEDGRGRPQLGRQKRGRHPWLKPLDWVDVPGLFARAMQQDGWCWRSSDLGQASALPESVSGRGGSAAG